jgi:hypothetical protein
MSVYQAAIDPRSKEQHNIVPIPIVLSVLSLVVSVATALWLGTHDPLGKGLSQYDFSTPKAALISSMEIQNKFDIKAIMQLAAATSDHIFGNAAEKQRTLKVWKEAEWRGNKVLFCSFERDGITEYSCEAVERNAQTGRWMPSSLPLIFENAGDSVSEEDKRLSKMVSRWKESGTL